MAKVKLNFDFQYYKGIKLQVIARGYPKRQLAKRFAIGGTNQNVWIPNKHLHPDGTIKENEDIDYVFRKAQRQLEIAGYLGPIVGIKRTSVIQEPIHHKQHVICDHCKTHIPFKEAYKTEWKEIDTHWYYCSKCEAGVFGGLVN